MFALDPESKAPAGGWDGRAGFRTEGEATAGRRAEDTAACAILGATPVWLPFGSVDYERHGDEAAVLDAIAAATEGVGALLLPGFPLSHPDHEWLARALMGSQMHSGRIGLYAEQPYARMTKSQPRVPPWGDETLGAQTVFGPVAASARDRVTKLRAIRRYSSQLPLLGMTRSLRRGPHSLLWGELVAWVDP